MHYTTVNGLPHFCLTLKKNALIKIVETMHVIGYDKLEARY